MTESPLAVTTRSDLIEEYHPGAVAVADPSGEIVARAGDVTRPFYIRSAAKPFQAQVALEAGAELPPTMLAIAASSHSGEPVHVALVDSILDRHGLDRSDLRCPPARPFSGADRRLAAQGEVERRPIYHNCSGKHAALLAACVAGGWDTATYLALEHPLQQQIHQLMREVTGDQVDPAGIDGCGLPVWRVTTAGLARAFSRLGNDSRFDRVRTAMGRYPMLVSGEGRADGMIGRWTGGAVKVGAAGCMGAALSGYGVGAKAWSGSASVAGVGVGLAMDWLGLTTISVQAGLETVLSPPVKGGGETVGRIQPVAVLE